MKKVSITSHPIHLEQQSSVFFGPENTELGITP